MGKTDLAKELKELRKKSGLSQGELSKKLGWKTPQLVSNIERGVCAYPLKSIPKVAKLFNIEEKCLRLMIFQYKVEMLKKRLKV